MSLLGRREVSERFEFRTSTFSYFKINDNLLLTLSFCAKCLVNLSMYIYPQRTLHSSNYSLYPVLAFMYAFSVLVSEVSRLCSALVFLGTVVDENFSLPIMICH